MVLQPNLVSGCALIPPFSVPNLRQSDSVFVLQQLSHLDEKKKLSQFLKVHILETLGVIWLKFEMWSDDIGRHFH